MRCPKCQRPLDASDGGFSICCADAALTWRCCDCAKVSQGFAFAYGRCPHCGGMLVAEDGPLDKAAAARFRQVAAGASDVEMLRWLSHRRQASARLAGIRTAFEIELGGRAFYQRAAADTTDPALRTAVRPLRA